MPTMDLIQASLSAPLDWATFESLVYEILAQDDLPGLRKLGGLADAGADAMQESLHQSTTRTELVVQITSEKAQQAKCSKTIRRLQEAGIEYEQLVIVYRDPVSSTIRRDIQATASKKGVAVDVRDESYLVAQLGHLKNGLFARYFQDVKTQVGKLLDQGDPLRCADTRLTHSMLASLGAYVAHPAAGMARPTLFDRTVLAVLVAASKPLTLNELLTSLSSLLPGESLQLEQIRASLRRLEKQNLCIHDVDCVAASDGALESVGATLIRIRAAFDNMLCQLLKDTNAHHKLDNAQLGRLERNLRRAVTLLVRIIKPTERVREDAVAELTEGQRTFREVLAAGIPDDVARTAVASLLEFVRAERNHNCLVSLARSYAALGLRNMDPLGRSWQLAYLARSSMLLDTDVVLFALIEELPEHKPLVTALKALTNAGVRLIVPQSVLQEAVGHVSRAERTYRKFGAVLNRMSPELVDIEVWHAVVRGFYYAGGGATYGEFRTYLAQYYDHSDPIGYGRFLLAGRIDCQLMEEVPVEPAHLADFETMVADILKEKEPGRLKAPYRDEEQMRERTEQHVRYALEVSRLSGVSVEAKAKGYIVSNDEVFQYIQQLPSWGARPLVHMHTSAAVALAEWACGVRVSDGQLIALVFNPVLATAAEDIADDLTALAEIGVELHETDIRRLEWDVKNAMQSQLLDFKRAIQRKCAQDRIECGIELARAAEDLGYRVDPAIGEVIAHYERVIHNAGEEQKRRIEAEELLKRLADAGSGLTKKGRRRVNRILREMGGLPLYDEDEGSEDTAAGGP